MSKPLSDYSDVELVALQAAADKEIAALRERKSIVARELEDRSTAKQAKAKFDAMSDAEKKKLLQMLQPAGIKSAESIGNIGGK